MWIEEAADGRNWKSRNWQKSLKTRRNRIGLMLKYIPLSLLYFSHPYCLFLTQSSCPSIPWFSYIRLWQSESQNQQLTSQQFKAQERESQRYRSKKKERAFLKAIPIIPVSSPYPLILIKLMYSQHPLFLSLLLPNLAFEIWRSFQSVVIPLPTSPRIWEP